MLPPTPLLPQNNVVKDGRLPSEGQPQLQNEYLLGKVKADESIRKSVWRNTPAEVFPWPPSRLYKKNQKGSTGFLRGNQCPRRLPLSGRPLSTPAQAPNQASGKHPVGG